MINLLPPNLVAATGFVKVQNILKSLNLVSLVVFIIFILGMAGFYTISTLQLNSVAGRNESLIQSIKALETTEQKLVLLKDRLSKIKTARSSESAKTQVEGISKVLSLLSPNSGISDLAFDSKKTDFTLNFRDSADLGVFLDSLVQSRPFTSIVLTSFGFNPTSGYIMSLRMTEVTK